MSNSLTDLFDQDWLLALVAVTFLVCVVLLFTQGYQFLQDQLRGFEPVPVQAATLEFSRENNTEVFLPAVARAEEPTPTPTPEPVAVVENVSEGERLSDAFPAEIVQWRDLIERYAAEYNLDPDLVGAVMYVESWFNPSNSAGYSRCPAGPASPSCTSVAGAIGMMQVMPFHFSANEDPRDPETNIRKGCAILRTYLDKMGTLEGGLAAYNAGVGGANRGLGWSYAQKVLNVYAMYRD